MTNTNLNLVNSSGNNTERKINNQRIVAGATGTATNSHQIKNNDWVSCAKWLDDCECLSPAIRHRLATGTLTINEFANALRDGEIVCNLANYLQPGCIDTTQINRRAHMSQMLCLKNIRLFLDACRSPLYFGLDEADLFDEHMLYEFDLAKVIRSLSILSRCEKSSERGCGGFYLQDSSINTASSNTGQNLSNTNGNFNNNGSHSTASISNQACTNLNDTCNTTASNLNNDDIYYNIIPTEVESPESYYTDESFLFGMQPPLQNQQNDNGVYQIIVQQSQQHQPLKRDFVIREILNTEENFINGLNTLMEDFLQPLSKCLNELDRKCICINIDALIALHKSLYSDLFQACKGGMGRSQRICNVFDQFKLSIMKEYAEYFSCIDRSLAKCDALSNSGSSSSSLYSNTKTGSYAQEFRTRLEECRKQSKRGNFKLTDLLRLPYQRVLKYHLLFNELLKQTDVEHSAKETIKRCRDSMCEVGNYLNECQRDKENLTKIEKIMAHLTVDIKGSGNLNTTNLKDYGHYIKDDKFRVKSIDAGERIARTRTFLLFEKALIVCKSKGDLYNYKEALLVDEYTIEDPSESNNSGGDVDLNLSSTSIGGASNSSGANAHSLILSSNIGVASGRCKVYAFFFKNQEQKRVWKQSLLDAKEKVQPKGQHANKHRFVFHNFEHEMVLCCVCRSYLLGIFYQGYKCDCCKLVAHKNCLTKSPLCTVANPPPNVKGPNKTGSIRFPTPPSQLERSLSSVSSKQQQQPIYVRAINKYDGRPPPPEQPVLVFNEGDLIQITDEDDDEWWKGYVIKSNQVEGYFPSRYVKVFLGFDATLNGAVTPPPITVLSKTSSLEEYSWFAPVDRSTADLILNRIQNIPLQTLFMVRCRQEGGYAISIKCNGLVDHIKINVLDAANLSLPSELATSSSSTTFYSIDQRNFKSVVDLVKYYCQHTLKENFPQLETTLGTPYRDALPPPISVSIAIHDYNPLTNPNNTGEQIELKRLSKYFILNKEQNGWFRCYNSDGLIGYAPGGYLREV